jgi:hypothetical protein
MTATQRSLRASVFLCLGWLLSGCAVPTTGIVPQGNDIYTVTRQGEGFWVATNELRAAVLREAGSYCEGKGKALKILHVKEIQAGALGRWPEAEAVFTCS